MRKEIPGWRLSNGTASASLLQRDLVPWNEVDTLARHRELLQYDASQPNYALSLVMETLLDLIRKVLS
jgi:hypothetical protein